MMQMTCALCVIYIIFKQLPQAPDPEVETFFTFLVSQRPKVYASRGGN